MNNGVTGPRSATNTPAEGVGVLEDSRPPGTNPPSETSRFTPPVPNDQRTFEVPPVPVSADRASTPSAGTQGAIQIGESGESDLTLAPVEAESSDPERHLRNHEEKQSVEGDHQPAKRADHEDWGREGSMPAIETIETFVAGGKEQSPPELPRLRVLACPDKQWPTGAEIHVSCVNNQTSSIVFIGLETRS
eukprot:SAG31_NODE_14594_length_797_cov_1.833811_1_plen_191_part_00